MKAESGSLRTIAERSGGKGNLMSRLYEVMFIVRPDIEDEEADKLIENLSATVKNGGGVVKSAEKLGRRKLAYQVRKFNDGNFILLTVEADGAVVLELERRLRVTEQVIKFITVRMDEEEKRLAKVKANRGVRRKVGGETAPAAVAPAASVPAASAPVVASATAAEPAPPVQASA
jgi:small subunit ribosomal protein S6